jgi:predicted nuclease of restriction endonuclease-like RecB superfamily
MLSSELLLTRIRGDEIAPQLIKPEGDHLELARDLIGIFSDHTGKKLGELNDILEEMEDQGFDYRLVRGLVSLLERRCDLAWTASVPCGCTQRSVLCGCPHIP